MMEGKSSAAFTHIYDGHYKREYVDTTKNQKEKKKETKSDNNKYSSFVLRCVRKTKSCGR